MGRIRYVVAIAFYLCIGAVGMVLGGFAAFCVFECLIGIAHTLIIQAGGPSSLRPIELMQYLGFWALLAAIGVVLMRFSWLGAVRRVQLGLPGINEGVGTTRLHRLLLGGLSSLVFIYGAGSMALGIMLSGPTAMNVLTHPRADAEVVSFKSLDAESRWLVTYRFTVNGQPVEGSAKYEADMRYTPDLRTVEVTHNPIDPLDHEVTSGYSIWEFALFVVWNAMLGLVGLWGLWRNAFPGLATQHSASAMFRSGQIVTPRF